jgi:hypothetical protein
MDTPQSTIPQEQHSNREGFFTRDAIANLYEIQELILQAYIVRHKIKPMERTSIPAYLMTTKELLEETTRIRTHIKLHAPL